MSIYILYKTWIWEKHLIRLRENISRPFTIFIWQSYKGYVIYSSINTTFKLFISQMLRYQIVFWIRVRWSYQYIDTVITMTNITTEYSKLKTTTALLSGRWYTKWFENVNGFSYHLKWYSDIQPEAANG